MSLFHAAKSLRGVSSLVAKRPELIRSSALTGVRGPAAFSSAAAASTDEVLFNPTEEHAQLRSMVRSFAESEIDEQALEFNRKEQFNRELFNKCGELGLLGATVDPEFGGSGFDATGSCIIHEEMSAADPAFTLSYLAHSLLFVNNLNQNGNDEQRARFLPAACDGSIVGGMGMSEPGAGTDVLGMSTSATQPDGPDGDFVLNGSKMWITNGCVDDETLGDVFLVYARTSAKGISLFLVEKGMEGFTLGSRIKDKLGMRASATAELSFQDVRVPRANLVGELDKAVLCMMRNLEIERVGLGAMATGIARRCVEVMNAYATEREAFGKPIREFGQIQRHIAESFASYAAGRCYLYTTSNGLALDAAGNRLHTDGVKLFCTTMAKQVADNAIQVLGGNGYTGEYQVEQLWRDAKLLEIGGGTLESHHKNMVRDLAAMDKLE